MTARISDVERFACWRLSRTEGIGPVTFKRLLQRYGSATQAIEALPDLAARGGRKNPLIAFPLDATGVELAAIAKTGARIVTLLDAEYPELLTQIDDAPPAMVVKGTLPLNTKPIVGIVGARNASLPGRKIAGMLARDLGAHGYYVASGLARGIDTAAHEGSMTTGTIAVVAGGIDVIYPPENARLYAQIAEQGTIISEHPAGQEPKAQFFPRRNRIISGLSQGTVVVEATLQSGSLITARTATEQGRDVFAVPGSPLDPRAGGPNSLIRDGAILIENADHVIEHLRLFAGGDGSILNDQLDDLFKLPDFTNDETEISRARETVLSNLSITPQLIDEIARISDTSIQVVNTILLELELADRAQRLPGNRIALMPEEENHEQFARRR